MKCALRREEIREILSHHFKVEVEDFIIVPSTPSLLGKRIRISMNDPKNMIFKVPNIRALRNISTELSKPMTLSEGKWAIENWETFISFIDEYNRLPLSGYGSGEGKGVLR